MAEKEIALLQEQINKLNDKKFDLEAWKNHTEIYLEQIFGKDNSVIKMIRELKYDYSSWSLRDVSGAGQPKNPVIEQAKEILDAAMERLKQFGLPGEIEEDKTSWKLLEEELTGKQMKELQNIIASESSSRKEKIVQILSNLDNEILAAIIAGILLPENK